MRTGLIVCVLAAPLLAQQVNVSGIAVDQAGSPLRGVHVRLVDGYFGEVGKPRTVYGADSDSTGHFAMTGLKPGSYAVFGDRPGYLDSVNLGSAGRFSMATLKAGQDVTDLKVTMMQLAEISGRVVDEFGDPVDRLEVQARPVSGRPVDVVANGPPDDRGEFRRSVPPGKYYVMASPWNQGAYYGEIRTDGTSAAPFVATYYPSATATSGASVVEVGAGQNVVGIEIRLQRGTAQPQGKSFTVTGIVTGAPASESIPVMLWFGSAPHQLHNARAAFTGTDGKFTVNGLQPGFYRAIAHFNSDKTPLQSHATDFLVEASDVSGIQLSLLPGEELSGTLVFTGEGASSVDGRTVSLDSVDDFFGEERSAKTADDGKFQISGVMSARYRATVKPLPDNAYLKEVAVDGKPAADGILDFSQGVGRSKLKVTVSRNGGQISGKVVDENGEPALGMVEVFLATDSKKLDDPGSAKRVVDGRYSFDTLRPGKYRLFAIDMVQMNEPEAFEEGMTSLFQAAEEIEIKDGDRLTRDLTAITKLPEKK